MTHRPFTVQEFLDLPPSAWCRNRGATDLYRISTVWITGDERGAKVSLGASYTLKQLSDWFELSLDGGRTWQPFGKEVVPS